MTSRTRIQVDASPELQEALRVIASNEYMNIRAVVLLSLAEKYPQLQELVDAELKRQ